MRRVPVCVCDRRVLYPLVDGLMMPARISMPGDSLQEACVVVAVVYACWRGRHEFAGRQVSCVL